MTHVIDDLELYALGALTSERAAEVERHIRTCSACETEAAQLRDLVGLLPDAVPLREPPTGLKARIMAAARADVRRAAATSWPRWLRPPFFDLRIAGLAAAILLLIGVDVGALARLQTAERARDSYETALVAMSHGGRWWYMAGVDSWTGSGGNLVAPRNGKPAFVLFHDLQELPAGQVYALWLIDSNGGWVRGTNFRPNGDEAQVVQVGLEIGTFERCAVTVESSTTGKRQGPLVMQSRIAPPTP